MGFARSVAARVINESERFAIEIKFVYVIFYAFGKIFACDLAFVAYANKPRFFIFGSKICLRVFITYNVFLAFFIFVAACGFNPDFQFVFYFIACGKD